METSTLEMPAGKWPDIFPLICDPDVDYPTALVGSRGLNGGVRALDIFDIEIPRNRSMKDRPV